MSGKTSKTLHHRGRVAALTRSRSADDPELVEERRKLNAASLEDHIRRVVDAAPKLTADQVEHLAAILRGGGPQ